MGFVDPAASRPFQSTASEEYHSSKFYLTVTNKYATISRESQRHLLPSPPKPSPVAESNSFAIRTYKKCAHNSFRIRTYKNARLKVL